MKDRLKLLRKTLGITLEEFGTKVGVTRSAIGRLEKGERNITEQMLISICREFNVNKEWLCSGTGTMFNSDKNILGSTKYKDMIFGAVSIMNIEQQKLLWNYIVENFSEEISDE